jgi:thioredoxin reductase
MSAAAAPWDAEYDLVVLGAGAGGMTAALTGAIEGMRVLLIEASRWIGGTTARSSGSVWIADNPHMRRAGIIGGMMGTRGEAAQLLRAASSRSTESIHP